MSEKLSSSFRDPSGFLFKHEQTLYRQINLAYQPDYDHLIQSGLYEHLIKAGAMLSHTEVDARISPDRAHLYQVIQPEKIRFISYPYEWCFAQIKEAAILTLAVAKRALEYGMSLKDASAYNVQFRDGRAIFIDTLSFEIFHEGQPWVAYRQFCQHFLAPLALMAYHDVRLHQLMRVNIDGIPLDLTSRLLPFRSRFNFGLFAHLHWHARSQQRYAGQSLDLDPNQRSLDRSALIRLLDNLLSTVKSLRVKDLNSEWAGYYQDTNYSQTAFEQKKKVLDGYLTHINPTSVWDLGANTGEFSRLASDRGIPVVAFDIDPGAVTENYRQVKANKEKYILPLIMDLTNPSPALGWHHHERSSLLERAPADLVLALALVHHLAIGNNVPLLKVAEFLSDLSQHLIIEFIPKSDSQVMRLLSTRQDIFPDYTEQGFEHAFTHFFNIAKKKAILDSERSLYLMKRKE